jgi:hypothetical protein
MPAIRMFLVQHSINGVARRVRLDSCRPGGIMMLQNRLTEQAVSQLIKSILTLRFPVKTLCFVNMLVNGKAVLAQLGINRQ